MAKAPTVSDTIILSGAPASGKTALGRALAQRLTLPFLDKDEILESLFEALGVGDPAWRQRLSRASDALFLHQIEQRPACVAVSFWRHPGSARRESGTPVDSLRTRAPHLIEVHCECPADLAVARFRQRVRHPGHLDDALVVDGMSDEAIRSQAALGPLGLATVLKADTSRPLDHLVDELSGAITSARDHS
ncbi:MAG: AAA family ATPase [Pseudomonadota bacterium]